MKSSRFSRLLVASILLAGFALCGAAQAQVGTEFTIVADSSQPQFQGRGFGTYPSINDDGTVAFVVDQVGTFRAVPGQAPVRVGGSVTGDPFINKLGEIASRQYVDAFNTAELYKATPSGRIVPLARNDVEFYSFTTPFHLSPAGTAVFWARKYPVSPRNWGIFTATGDGTTRLVVDDKGEFSVFGGGPTINSAGTVAFTGGKDPVNNVAETGLYLGSVGGNGVTTTVLTAAGSPLYNWDGNPYLNDKGQIAFKAYEDSTGEPGIFVVNQDGSGLRTIARSGGIGGDGPYSMLDSPIINEVGTVVFRGYLDTGERGIYVGNDPVADKVIQQGDPLFGSTATSVVFLRGLNNNDQIAFYFELADGRSGIATARLVRTNTEPAPSPTPTATPTATATATPTATPTATATATPTATPTATATATPEPTASPEPTVTPQPTATIAPSPTPTAEPIASPTPTVAPSPTPVSTVAPQSQPLNIATRVRVETGENVAIAGFIVSGDTAKKVVIRGLGPSLRGAGVANALPDPALELHSSDGTLVGKNNNWGDDLGPASELEANGFAPKDELEAALVVTLAPGYYTAMISGQNSVTGIALIEVYDFDQNGASRLANISTRALVQPNESVLIGGFILGNGDSETKVLVRALGPSLGAAGIANPASDPTLELHDGNGALLIANDNWKDQQQAAIEATGIPPNDPAEAAIVADLPPGAYTAVVAGKNGSAGVALIEVYNLR